MKVNTPKRISAENLITRVTHAASDGSQKFLRRPRYHADAAMGGNP